MATSPFSVVSAEANSPSTSTSPSSSIPSVSSISASFVPGWLNLDVLPVLGSSLAQLVLEQRSGSLRGVAVPLWLASLCEHVLDEFERDPTKAALLYNERTVQASAAQLDALERVYATLCAGNLVAWSACDLALSVRLLRLLVEKLPEPLLTFEAHDLFVGAVQDVWAHAEEQLAFLRAVLSALPATHAQLLARLARLFATVQTSYAGWERRTLALVWGPTLLLRRGMHPFQATLEDSARLVELLATHATRLFAPASPSASPAATVAVATWLLEQNARKKASVTAWLQKLRTVTNYLQTLDARHHLGLEEFVHHAALLEARVGVLEAHWHALHDSPQPQLVDTYHLARSYRYLCDLDETLHCVQELASQDGVGEARLLLYFTNERLRERLERLRLTLHYEAALFVDALALNLAASSSGTSGAEAAVRATSSTLEAAGVRLIDHARARDMWREHFGVGRYLIGWSHFFETYVACAQLPNPPSAEARARLQAVLDPHKTGWVTVYRFAELLKSFRQPELRVALQVALATVAKPYFDAYLSRAAIAHLFEPQPVGSFVVRLSQSSPGSFAFDYKKAEGLFATKISLDSTSGRYLVIESADVTRTFDTVGDVVDYYSRVGLLLHPLPTSIVHAPYFYGFLTMEETEWFLQGERQGTYLVRFSLTFKDQLTISYVGPEGINSLRLERLASGKVRFMEQQFNSVDEALNEYSALFTRPYHDIVSLQLEEDDEWRRSLGRGDSSCEVFFTPRNILPPPVPPSTRALSDDLSALLLYSARTELATDPHLSDSLLSRCFARNMDERQFSAMVKLAHSTHCKLLGMKRVKSTPSCLRLDGVDVNRRHLLTLTLHNASRSRAVRYSFIEPVLIDRRCFLSVVAPEGVLAPAGSKGSSIRLDVVVVLFKPVVLKRVLSVRCEYLDTATPPAVLAGSSAISHSTIGSQNPELLWLHIPLWIGCDKRMLVPDDGGTSPALPPYWVITEEDFKTGESISGSVGNVNSANLYGAKVAVKRWDFGAKQPPPESFVHELNILRELQHDNLVMFIGARADKPGMCYIITEYCVNNSLFNYLPQHKLSNAERMQIALDAATGMHFVHMHNLVHRDLKSLNLLVDARGRIKVADFGETRVVSHLMTPERGSYNWMAPEVLKTRTYTGKADVFSFGIILWEICTAQRPDRLMSDILAGVTFIFPKVWYKQLPELVYVAKLCWQLNPAKRPSFAFLTQKLQDGLDRLTRTGNYKDRTASPDDKEKDKSNDLPREEELSRKKSRSPPRKKKSSKDS